MIKMHPRMASIWVAMETIFVNSSATREASNSIPCFFVREYGNCDNIYIFPDNLGFLTFSMMVST